MFGLTNEKIDGICSLFDTLLYVTEKLANGRNIITMK